MFSFAHGAVTYRLQSIRVKSERSVCLILGATARNDLPSPQVRNQPGSIGRHHNSV